MKHDPRRDPDVLGRLGGSSRCPAAGEDKAPAVVGKSGGKDFGVFQNANDARRCGRAFLQLREQGVEARRKIIEIVKGMCEQNAGEWVASSWRNPRLAVSITR